MPTTERGELRVLGPLDPGGQVDQGVDPLERRGQVARRPEVGTEDLDLVGPAQAGRRPSPGGPGPGRNARGGGLRRRRAGPGSRWRR